MSSQVCGGMSSRVCGDTVKIASAPGPDLGMDQKWTRNGSGMDLDWIWTGA